MPAFSQVGLNDVAFDKDLVSLTTRRWKYIYHRRAKSEELFDLTVDPAEQNNIAAEDEPGAVPLRNAVAEFLSWERELSEVETAPMEPKARDQLRSLGYLQ